MSAATSPGSSPAGPAQTSSTRRSARTPGDLCPCCGRHALRPALRPGRACRYRNLTLTLPAELPVPTCRLCKHMVLTYEAIPQLAATLQQAFRAELVQRATAEITQLSRFCSQRKLELAIDLSQGYLCRLRTGQGVPSVALISLLALLRAEPDRLEELRRYWALPLEPPPSRVPRRRPAIKAPPREASGPRRVLLPKDEDGSRGDGFAGEPSRLCASGEGNGRAALASLKQTVSKEPRFAVEASGCGPSSVPRTETRRWTPRSRWRQDLMAPEGALASQRKPAGPDRHSARCWRLKTTREKEFVRGVACALGLVADPTVGGAPEVAAQIACLVSLTVHDFRRAGADEADLEPFREQLETQTARAREIATTLAEVPVPERSDVR